jgi:hypothetical protein
VHGGDDVGDDGLALEFALTASAPTISSVIEPQQWQQQHLRCSIII